AGLEAASGPGALSEASLTGRREPGLADAVVKGGDHMLRDAVNLRRRITGFTVGYKPNALGFMAIALSEASLAAADAHRATGDPRYLERAEAYRSMALELGDDLLRMQNQDGSWHDGPYYTEDYGDWRVISSWYQSMAWSGLAQASRVAGEERRGEYLRGVELGMRWVRAMEMPGGGYRGTLYPNGSMTEDDAGSTMVLQGFAIANSAGIDTRGEYLLLFLHTGVKGWDGNMAFAYSEMLRGLGDRGGNLSRLSPLRVVLSFDVETPRCIANLPEVLAFLEERKAGATFYFTGAMAERYPGGVRSVLERGHEVGSHGYAHEFPVFRMEDAAILAGAHGRPLESVWDGSARTQRGYLEALGKSRRALEEAGTKPRTYRSPVLAPSLTKDLAYLRALEEAGFTVDSSLLRRDLAADAARLVYGNVTILPVSISDGELSDPGPALAYAGEHRSKGLPFVIVLHPWRYDGRRLEALGLFLRSLEEAYGVEYVTVGEAAGSESLYIITSPEGSENLFRGS
ncbi:MAG: polysaccharide deacetylase family protein, partial [Candidatus Hydrothermarchaeota archaeon]